MVAPLTSPTHDNAEAAFGLPITANEKGLPTITVGPVANFSVMSKVVSVKLDAVSENVNVVPPLANVSAGDPVAPTVVYVGALKSDESATARPSASNTVTVHEMTSLTRTYVVDKLVAPAHDSTDAAVADDTLNENGLPPEISALLDAIFSVTRNVVIAPGAAVNTNVKLAPPPTDVSVTAPVPPVVYVGTVKSVASPVVAAVADFVVTVHDITSPTRTTDVNPLTCPMQVSADATAGVPNTTNENGLFTITVLPDVFSVI